MERLELWLELRIGSAAASVVSNLMFRPDGSLPNVRYGDRDANLRPVYPLTALCLPA